MLAAKISGHDAVVFSAGAHGTGMDRTTPIDGRGLEKASRRGRPRKRVLRRGAAMREWAITGATRGKKVCTTVTDPSAEQAPDLVERDFVADAPNRTWVADFTHVADWAGTVNLAFVVGTFSRRIVGWSAATTKHTELVLAAVEMDLWQRDREGSPDSSSITAMRAASTPRSSWPPTWTAKASPPPSARSATPTINAGLEVPGSACFWPQSIRQGDVYSDGCPNGGWRTPTRTTPTVRCG
ncbi:DDE-type integrase/transposase/recombinase [Streptomyces sp. NPDC000880]